LEVFLRKKSKTLNELAAYFMVAGGYSHGPFIGPFILGIVAILQQERPTAHAGTKFNSDVDCHDFLFLSRSEGRPQSRPAGRRDRVKRLDAAKLERLGRLVCGPLWQSELARTMGVSRQTVLRWAAGEFDPSPQHTAKAKKLVRARIGELQRLLKAL
jgi:DNA-binding XRE family transcriptional regulator